MSSNLFTTSKHLILNKKEVNHLNIQSISKEKREAVVTLNSDELVLLCNLMYQAPKEYQNRQLTNQLHSEMMIARDLSQYGLIDNFSIGRIVAAREAAGGEVKTHPSKRQKDIENENK